MKTVLLSRILSVLTSLLQEAKINNQNGVTIVQKISDFATTVNAALTAIGTALTNIQADEAQLVTDIKALQDQLAASAVSAGDLAALNAIAVSAQALATRTASIADALPATPPPIPPPPAA